MEVFNFKKERKKYIVIKLFKVVNFEQSKTFPMKECFKLFSMFFKDNIGTFPNSTSINYQSKSWKSYNGFLKGVLNKKDSDIVWLYSGFNDEKNQNLFTISNTMMNYNRQPEKQTIVINISIDYKRVDVKDILRFLNNIYTIFNFDYGYRLFLKDNFYFHTERKKTTWYKKEHHFLKDLDRQWSVYNIGVIEGFIKKVYKFNILNDSHLSQPVIQSLIGSGVGEIQSLNDKLSIWHLSEDDYKKASQQLNQSKYVIYNKEYPSLFIETEDAKKFENLTKVI